MERPSIIYTVRPSFGGNSTVHLTWDDHSKQYQLYVSKGWQFYVSKGDEGDKQYLFDENPELDAILEAVANLQIPIPACVGIDGIDGTTYDFAIGESSFASNPSITFTWWETLPPEWTELGKIIKAIDRVTKKL